MANESRNQSQRVSAALSRIYSERRGRAERQALQRTQSAYEQYPDLQKMEQKVAMAGAELLVASRGDTSEKELQVAREEAHDRLLEAEQERQGWLRAHDLPDGYSDPDWSCRTCRDTGYVKQEPCPRCYRATLIPLLFDMNTVSGLTEGTFEDSDLTLFRDKPIEGEDPKHTPLQVMTKIQRAMQKWAGEFTSTKKDLLFMGATGTGKSYLASAIARKVIEQGCSVAFLSSPTFFDIIGQFQTMKQMFNPNPVDYSMAKERYEALFDAELLVIDDLGTEYRSSQKVGAELLTILDRRHQANRRTIVISNLDAPELRANFDERLTSRLLGRSIPIRFPGEEQGDDVRLRLHRRN